MRRTLAVVAIVLLLGILASAVVGEALTRPALRSVGSAPPELRAESVRIPTAGKEFVVGWFHKGVTGKGSILLLHGVRSDRRQMLTRARFLSNAGYSVLLIDLPGHGESPADRITFGAHESKGVDAAMNYLRRENPTDRVGVIGVSLGAASTVFSAARPGPDAVVLESMYPTISDAVDDRLAIRFGPLGKTLSPLLLWQLPLRIGIAPGQLRPIDRVRVLRAPVLIASGTLDLRTPIAETRAIFLAANRPKELWQVKGAAHVDLASYAPLAYKSTILAFFQKYLTQPARLPRKQADPLRLTQ